MASNLHTRLAKLESKCKPDKLIERFQMGTLYGEPATEPLYYPAGHVFTMADLYPTKQDEEELAG